MIKTLIKQLRLKQHPEGGYYRETYRSKEFIPAKALPRRFNDRRTFSTAIYFLITKERPSAFHRIKSDELWHFYQGDPVEITMILKNKKKKKIILGSGEFQAVIPAGLWFSAKTLGQYSLVGCTVAPGFDFADFQLK